MRRTKPPAKMSRELKRNVFYEGEGISFLDIGNI
jgi:hypothetical protein